MDWSPVGLSAGPAYPRGIGVDVGGRAARFVPCASRRRRRTDQAVREYSGAVRCRLRHRARADPRCARPERGRQDDRGAHPHHAVAARVRAGELLERFDLVDAGDRVVKGYSGGMRRRLDIAMSLIARPSVLFLDEPTTGLDPRSRQSVWDLIDELVRGGTTTLLTTQYLDEADRLADDIVVIDRGSAIARGTSDELKRQIGGELVEVIVDDPADAPRVMELLGDATCGECHVGDDGRTVSIPVPELAGLVPVVVRRLDEAGIAIRDVSGRGSTLDDVFFALTGHAAEDAATDGETGGTRAAPPTGNGDRGAEPVAAQEAVR